MRSNQVVTSSSALEKLSWIPLSPDELREQLLYYGRIRPDVDRYYIDKRLANAFDLVNQEAKRQKCRPMYDQAEFSAALRDRKFTKFFTHWGPTLANVDHFLDPKCDRPDARWLRANKAAVRLILNDFKRIGMLQPLPITTEDDCLKVFGDSSTSVGFGGHGSKRDNIAFIKATVDSLMNRIANESNVKPEEKTRSVAVCFHRSQISDYVSADGEHYKPDSTQKDRLVLGIDGATIVVEGRFARPVYEAILKQWWNYSGGDDPERMREKMQYAKRHSYYWFQTDFSRFDQTLPAWLIYEAFDIVKTLFPKKYHHELAWIANNFVNTRILLPGGEVIEKHRGIPSGSYFTQVIGSLCNAIMILTYLCSMVGGSEDNMVWRVRNMLNSDGSSPMTFLVLGDDSIFFLDRPIDIATMSSYLLKVFGVTLSEGKTITSHEAKYPHYLKRDWTSRGEWRNPLELAIALTHPERERKYDTYSPWHIMYGLYLTYRAAFPRCITENWLIKKMHEHGGIDALVELEVKDLPGPLRGYGDSARIRKYILAKAMLERVEAA